MIFSLPLVSLALAACAAAVPTFAPPAGLARPPAGKRTCDISSAKLVLPSGQTALASPTGPPSFVLLGIGYQNYTCSSGTWTAAGAVADLYDLSCISKVPAAFDRVQDLAYLAWKALPIGLRSFGPNAAGYPLVGSHFFQPSPSGTGISPVWDARNGIAKGRPNAFVLAAKVADIPAPTDPKKDVAWLELKNVSGGLATQIYRTDTRGGPAPASCTPGAKPISVKYVSKYWGYGGTEKL